MVQLILLHALILLLSPCYSFKPPYPTLLTSRKRCKVIVTADIQISTPSPEKAVRIGVREWPQQLKSGVWTEDVTDGNTVTRYILDGAGTVSISSDEDGTQLAAVGPGTLVEVTGRASLLWSTSEEMIVLTPGYEEGRLLLTVALALIALTILLVSGVGGH